MSEPHTPNGGYFVKITNRELWDGLRAVEQAVTRLENRMDNVLTENVDLRKRVRALELRFYGVLAGLIGAIALLVRLGNVTA